MFFEILTLFPGMFTEVFSQSIIKRSIEKGLVSVHIENIRDYADDRYKGVDDYPYGGDPGMLMKPQPVAKAIRAAKDKHTPEAPKVVLLSPHGMVLTHSVVEKLATERVLILLCGRYKGIDHRIRQKYVDCEISIGDYILSGGEIPAMVLLDAVIRLIPGVLGNSDSAAEDCFFNGLLSAPQYTRPESFEGMVVPGVLLGGNHEKIRAWKKEQARRMTQEMRPDLWERYCRRKMKENKDYSI